MGIAFRNGQVSGKARFLGRRVSAPVSWTRLRHVPAPSVGKRSRVVKAEPSGACRRAISGAAVNSGCLLRVRSDQILCAVRPRCRFGRASVAARLGAALVQPAQPSGLGAVSGLRFFGVGAVMFRRPHLKTGADWHHHGTPGPADRPCPSREAVPIPSRAHSGKPCPFREALPIPGSGRRSATTSTTNAPSPAAARGWCPRRSG